MKKLMLICLLTFSASLAFSGDREKLMDCALYEIYDQSLFEEGLSADEYPDLWVFSKDGQLKVTLGGFTFYEEDGDKIHFRSSEEDTLDGTVTKANLMISMSYGSLVLNHETSSTKNSAKLLFKKNGSEAYAKVADFLCDWVSTP